MGKKNGVLAACVLASIAGLGFPGTPVQAEGITFSGSSGGSVTVVTSDGSTVISSDGSGSVTITVPITVTISGGTSTGNNDGTTPASGNTLTVDDGSTIDGAIGGSTVTTVEKAMTDSIKADTVSGNTLTISDGIVSNMAAGGLSIAANVTENEANLSVTDSGTASAVVMAGGISGTGNANTNTLSISGGSVSELAAGGVTDYGAASGNKVTMSGGSVYKLVGGASVGGVTTLSNTLIDDFSSLGSRLDYKGTAGGSTENNEVTMSGGSATYVWGAYNWNLTGTAGNADVNGNQVTISDAAVVNGQVVGGEADAGSADDNAVIIKGGTFNGGASGSGPQGMSVIGANTNVAGSGGANTNNSVTISGGTFGETAVQYGNRIIGAYSQSNQEDISGNSVNISGGTFGQAAGSVNYVYGAYDWGTGSTLSKNTVTISGGTLDAKGGYDIILGAYAKTAGTGNTLSGNKVSITGGTVGGSSAADAVQIKGAQIGEGNYDGTASENTVDIDGTKVTFGNISSMEVSGGVVNQGTSTGNQVNVKNATLAASSSLNLIGGEVMGTGTAEGNIVTISDSTLGSETGSGIAVLGGFSASGNATGNTITLTNVTADSASNQNIIIRGGYAAGDATDNTVNISGGTYGTHSQAVQIIGGQAATGKATGNIINYSGGTVSGDMIGGIANANAANDNIINLNGALETTYTLYGGIGATAGTGNTLNVKAGDSVVGSIQNFQKLDIAPDASLTVGEADSANENALNVQQIIHYGSTLTKTGAGMLTVNNTLDTYLGAYTQEAGTTNLNADLNLANKFDIQAGVLNLKDVTMDDLHAKLAADGLTTTNTDDRLTIAGINGSLMNTKGSLVTAEGTIVNAGNITVKAGSFIDAQGALNIRGDLSAEASTVTANNATVGGSVSSTNGSTVTLGGSALSLSKVNVDTGSTLTLNGGTLTAAKLSDAVTGGGKVTLDGTATLATTADQIFTDANTTETMADSTNTLTDTAKNSVIFKAGTLSLNNDYSYTYLTNIQGVMDTLENSTTSLLMTGNLVDTTGISNTISVANASASGSNVALDTVTAATNDQNLVIGGTAADTNTTAVSQGFSVAALDLGSASSVTVTGGQSLTLGGSGTTDVISTTSDNAEVSWTDGSNLPIGNSTVGADQTLNVNASVAATDSTVTTNGQTNIEGTVTLTNSTIQANTGTLTVAQDLTTGGTSTITGSVAVAGDIVATAADDGTTATLNVGTDTTAAAVSAKSASLAGGTLYLDPVWQNGDTIGDGSKAALGSVSDAKLVVGNNSTLTLGSTVTSLAEKAFADTGLSWGSDGILSALYVNSSQSLSNNSIVVDSAASSTSGTEYGIFTMGANSLLMVNGSAVTSTAALTNVKSVSMDSSAKLYIDGATSNTTYNILSAASGGDVKTDNTWYADANAATKNILTNNQLLKFIGADGNGTSQFSVTAIAQDASDVYGKAIIDPNVVNAAMAGSGASADFFNNAVNNQVNTTTAQQANAINSQAAMTELGGVQHGLYTANNLFDSAVMNHLADLEQADKDKDIWAHYIHSKEDIDGLALATLGGASYKAQYNGVIVGSDFYTKGNAVAGAAFTYIDGSLDGNTSTATTKNDADYYGLSLYGRLTHGRTNYLGDISWLHGKNDLTQYNSLKELTGSVSSNAFSAGVRAEQNFTAGKGLLTPYVGLRYAHLDFGDYTDSIGVHHDADTANIWLLPVGLRYSLTSQHGNWTIKPIAEAGYLWTLGDRDGTETVSLDGQASAFGFDLADSGTYYGRLGVEAQKGDITYSIGYQYQKGDSVRSNTWMAAVRYKF